jgi:hypothetical protein
LGQEQRTDSLKSQPNYILRLSIPSPSFSLEKQISSNSTFVFNLYISSFSVSFSKSTQIYLGDAIIGFEPRYYFSLEERLREGKVTEYYSGSYLGLLIEAGINNYRIMIGPLYGFQNELGWNLFWNIGFGVGWFQYEDFKGYIINAYLKVGFRVY